MRGERIDLRVTREEKMAWFTHAQKADVRLGDWIRAMCNHAIAPITGFEVTKIDEREGSITLSPTYGK